MKNNLGFAHLYVMGVLIIVTIGVAYVAVNVANEAKNQLKEDSGISSQEAAKNYLGSSAGEQSTASKNNPSSSAPAKPASGSTDVTKQIAGNSNPAVAPVVSKNVTPPKTSIDSIRTFFAAIKSGDFVTANALMGPALAAEIAKVSNTSDTTKALSECKNNKTCNLLLNSFQPPTDGYKITKYTAKNGNAGEQISFPLSKSSPLLASQIGDYNLDIFSEKYAGDIWVIQNVYIDGSPISAYF